MKKILILLIAVVALSSCYEYRKLPNTSRVKKRNMNNAMKYSTWEYNNNVKTITSNYH